MGLANLDEPRDRLKVLHLCSGYAKQRLYAEMISHLSARGVEQFVYVPVRTEKEINSNRLTEHSELGYRYSHILRKYHRIFFRMKVHRVLSDLQKHTNINRYSLIHAHFLYSDGGVARKIQKITGIPYIVAVRNTDINVFMKLRPDLRWICWDIVRNAARIIFVTPSYRQLMCQLAPADIREILENNSEIVPNGIEQLWLDNIGIVNRPIENPLRLLYVGDFSKNKNVFGTMKAAYIVNEEYPVTLTLVGDNGSKEGFVSKLLASGRWPFIKRVGRIENRLSLRDIYRSHDIFIMPSFFETFGMAYIEALSQGLPVVHSRGQGIDGYFYEGTIAEAVNPSNATSIANGILALMRRLPAIRSQCVQAARNFSWDEIAKSYKRIYIEIVECNTS